MNRNENDLYLIMKVVTQMLGVNQSESFIKILEGMKVHGISFEAITRQRRKFVEEHPDLVSEKTKAIREQEKENYYLEFSK